MATNTQQPAPTRSILIVSQKSEGGGNSCEIHEAPVTVGFSDKAKWCGTQTFLTKPASFSPLPNVRLPYNLNLSSTVSQRKLLKGRPFPLNTYFSLPTTFTHSWAPSTFPPTYIIRSIWCCFFSSTAPYASLLTTLTTFTSPNRMLFSHKSSEDFPTQ